jgi:prepilin-type processing-associated H-X9-DG protein
MSLQQKRRLDFALVIGLVAAAAAALAWVQAKKSVAPEELMPADAVVYGRWAGIASQRDAYNKSALHDVIEQTSLGKFIGHVAECVQQAMGAPQVGPIRDILDEVWQHGAAVALSFATVPKVEPQLTIVLPGAAAKARVERLEKAVRELAEGKATSQVLEGRTVWSTGQADDELNWWIEGDHVVLTVGRGTVEATMARVAGKSPNLTSTDAYRAIQPDAKTKPLLQLAGDIRRATQLLVDSRAIDAETLGQLGFDGVNHLSYYVAFEGRALRSELRIDAPAPRRGVVKILLDQPRLTLADLPALPEETTGFSAIGLDITRTVYDVLELVKRMGGVTDQQIEQGFAQVDEALGLRLREDILLALGGKIVIVDTGGQAIPGVGAGIAVEIRDSAVMRKLAARIAQLLQEGAGIQLVEEKLGDTEMYGVELPPGLPFAIRPTWAVTDRWVVLGFTQEAVQAFAQCQTGVRATWKPDAKFTQSRGTIPTEGNWISWNDPRPTVEALLGYLPAIIEQIAQASGVQIDAALLPTAKDVNQYLFPGHAALVVDDRGLRWVGTSSVPVLSIGSPDSLTVGAVGVALLLPAVQQAREAARRAQDRNNLKQIALAMHNYHSTHDEFPTGTVDAPNLKPEERLSWQASILPFLEEGATYNTLDLKKPWDDPANKGRATSIPTYLNPQLTDVTDANGNAMTHYAGMAGLGADAPELAKGDKRAGIFGYNRKVGIRDITDGTANTIMAMDVVGKLGPWARGGSATIRSLTAEPYLNGPDGIGGNFAGGANFVFADGSVRFISQNIDPKVMRALATMAGGEVIGGDDF